MKKLAHLEAMRGIAALIVVIYHLLCAFTPYDIWSAQPWFGLINGPGAVMFFFVLSGYVLTLAAFQRNDLTIIFRGLIKRWPRLAGPVLLAVLLSWAIFHLGMYWTSEAATAGGSPFIQAAAQTFDASDMSLAAALRQGLYGAFAHSESWFDAPLWTMKWEASGSIVAFGLAATLVVARDRRLQILLLLIVIGPLLYKSPIFLTFWLGVSLAWLLSFRPIELPTLPAFLMVIIGIYAIGYEPNFLSYRPAFDFYGWLRPINETYIQALGSFAILVGVSCCVNLRRPLDGKTGLLLGQYSFPIYLTHLIMIFSVGTITFVSLMPLCGYYYASVLAVIASLLASVVVAYAFVRFEIRWVEMVNATATIITRVVVLRPIRTASKKNSKKNPYHLEP